MVPPTWSVPLAGLTLTEDTGTVTCPTVSETVALLPSQVAVIVTVPDESPDTRPVAVTVATLDALVVQTTERPVRT
jgi:hypothetical protein